MRGLLFIKETTESSCSCGSLRKSVPLGKKKRIRPFIFSLLPLCQGECGSAKYTFKWFSLSISLKPLNSEPLSKVKVIGCINSDTFEKAVEKALLITDIVLSSHLAATSKREHLSIAVTKYTTNIM